MTTSEDALRQLMETDSERLQLREEAANHQAERKPKPAQRAKSSRIPVDLDLYRLVMQAAELERRLALAARETEQVRKGLSETLQQAREQLAPHRPDVINHLEKPPRPLCQDIRRITAQFYGIDDSYMGSARRAAHYAYPRQVAMYLCQMVTDSTTTYIGRHFGGRDHSTVLHACKKITHLRETDERVRDELQLLLMKIRELTGWGENGA